MEQEDTVLLKDYTDEEKGAYLATLAAFATVDGHASEEELQFLRILSEAAEMPERLEEEVIAIAKNPSQINLQKTLDVLKGSELRFPFISDIIAFAKSDGKYTADEKKYIKDVANYLQVDEKQFSILEEYVNKAEDAQKHGEDPTSNSFLNKSGFGDMFKNAGISPGMVKGMLGVVAPLVIAGMMSRGGRRSRMMGGFGGMGGGGLLGGLLGGMMMGGGMRRTGGLGSMASILGGLNGRRGYSSMGSGGLGSLLGGILGGRRGGW